MKTFKVSIKRVEEFYFEVEVQAKSRAFALEKAGHNIERGDYSHEDGCLEESGTAAIDAWEKTE